MSKKLMVLMIRDSEGVLFDFDTYIDPKYIPDLQQRGLEIYPVKNDYPKWVAGYKLVNVWCFFQDLINFKNPFGNS